MQTCSCGELQPAWATYGTGDWTTSSSTTEQLFGEVPSHTTRHSVKHTLCLKYSQRYFIIEQKETSRHSSKVQDAPFDRITFHVRVNSFSPDTNIYVRCILLNANMLDKIDSRLGFPYTAPDASPRHACYCVVVLSSYPSFGHQYQAISSNFFSCRSL